LISCCGQVRPYQFKSLPGRRAEINQNHCLARLFPKIAVPKFDLAIFTYTDYKSKIASASIMIALKVNMMRQKFDFNGCVQKCPIITLLENAFFIPDKEIQTSLRCADLLKSLRNV
jgi:hypothetical protein